jgi:hypothetical protein
MNPNYFDTKDMFLEPKVNQYAGHMVMTGVTKPTKTRYLTIDTRFRTNSHTQVIPTPSVTSSNAPNCAKLTPSISNKHTLTNTNCSIKEYDDVSYNRVANYSFDLPYRINEVKSMSIKTCEIPITFYNISAALGNNAFQITIGSTPSIIVLPDTQYTEATLITALNNLLIGTGLTYSIVNKFSVFTNTSANIIKVNFDVDMYGSQTTTNLRFRLGGILGYPYSSYVINVSKNIQSPGFLDLNGPRYIYLDLDEFSNSNPLSFSTQFDNTSNNKNILGRFTMDRNNFPFGTIMPVNFGNGRLATDTRVYSGKVDLYRLNVRLVNEIGLPIDLNGQDFSFCLEIQHE